MKILALSNLYPPNAIGGYEVLCHDVMQALADRGHDITVLTSSYGGKHEEYPRQRVLRSLILPATEGNIYQPYAASGEEKAAVNRHNCELLVQTLAAENPDVIFVWNLYFFDRSLFDVLEQLGKPQVYLLTDNWLIASCNAAFIADYFAREVKAPSSCRRSWLRRLRRWFAGTPRVPRAMHGAAIFASRFMQSLYQDAGFTFGAQTIIHHGVRSVSAVEPTDRSRLLTPGELRLLFAGRIVEIKGVHTIIEALPRILRRMSDVRVKLTILGDDRDQGYLGALRRRIEELKLAPYVDFLPPVAEGALPDVFSAHDIYLFPSLYEPFSLTLIHALQAGIPTVASTAGGTPEIVLHRRTGLLFQAGNPADLARQVVTLAGCGELRQSICSEARDFAGGFTFASMVDKVEAYLCSIHLEEG